MDDAGRVRGFQTAAYLANDSGGLQRRQLATLNDQVLQVHTFNEVHRDELCVAVLTDIKDANDVFVNDRLCEYDFVLESLQCSRSCRHFSKDRLERNHTCELAIESFVNGAHPSDPKEIDDL